MKTIIKISATLLTAILFTACGGSSSSAPSTASNSATDYGTNERMITGKTYTINSGDEIEKISNNPEIEIVNDLNNSITTAKLISGEAAIIRD
jgi:ABC-type Fe3+-hydroxamate transport system substrate-binding protein